MAKEQGEQDEHSRKTHSFSTRQTTLLEFPIIVPITVRWGDMDAFGHVNNTCYFRYFEQARMAYFHRAIDAQQSPPAGIGPILHSTSCRFRAPVTHPDTLQVAARVKAIEADRFTMVYRVYSDRLDCVAADGEAIVVAFDYKSGTKAMVPPTWIQEIETLEGHKVRSND